jgi:hypothetical protein
MFWPLPLWLKVAVGLWTMALGLLYYFFTCNFGYWKKKGVVFEKGYPFFGSLKDTMTLKEHVMISFSNIYKKYRGERFVGYYQGRSPGLLIIDPELIKSIVVKDFSHFYDHGFKVYDF